MKIQTCLIKLPGNTKIKEVRKPSEITIETSFKELVSRAEIVLPRNVEAFDKQKVRTVFAHGAYITIAFGYDGNNRLEFQGYITEVSADYPVKIKCQDEMWVLRKKAVNFNAGSATLQGMLEAIAPGYTVDALEGVNLGKVMFTNVTVGDVLEKLRTDYSLYSYMDGSTLKCGKYYADNTNDPVYSLDLDRGIVENKLQYRAAEDVAVRIKGKATTPAGLKLEFETGEGGGDELNLTYTRVNNKDDLERLVKEDYAKRKRGGYEGSVTAFAVPFFKHGRKVLLKSRLFPDRTGQYYIDAIKKNYNNTGIKQELTLGGRV